MRIAIASRIFAPEPSAATFRLTALARALSVAGHEVEVLTVRPPKGMEPEPTPYIVRRFPVIRDSQNYVRGYVPYLSFDIPLIFRLLRRRYDVVVVEPPPTTGLATRIATTLTRTPYVYYAADIWADAAAQTGAPGLISATVRQIEKIAWNGARAILAVSSGVEDRLAQLGVKPRVTMIGNGIAAEAFTDSALGADSAAAFKLSAGAPEFVYAGTASEWHGASIFVDALAQIAPDYPDARVRFIGGGSQRDAIDERARMLGMSDRIIMQPVAAPRDLAPILRGSAAALASVLPGAGYDFAFPTKLYSAAVCGAPLIYAGIGPGRDFVNTEVAGAPLGQAVDYDPGALATTMRKALENPFAPQRRAQVSEWAVANVSLTAVAKRAVESIEAI